jgi:hypothetical protein
MNGYIPVRVSLIIYTVLCGWIHGVNAVAAKALVMVSFSSFRRPFGAVKRFVICFSNDGYSIVVNVMQ